MLKWFRLSIISVEKVTLVASKTIKVERNEPKWCQRGMRNEAELSIQKTNKKIFPGHRIIPTEENKKTFFPSLPLRIHSRAAVQNLILRL
jgi:hypothetical protein